MLKTSFAAPLLAMLAGTALAVAAPAMALANPPVDHPSDDHHDKKDEHKEGHDDGHHDKKDEHKPGHA